MSTNIILKGRKNRVMKELKKTMLSLRGYENDSYVEIDEDLNISVVGDIKTGYMKDWRGKPVKKKPVKRVKFKSGDKHE